MANKAETGKEQRDLFDRSNKNDVGLKKVQELIKNNFKDEINDLFVLEKDKNKDENQLNKFNEPDLQKKLAKSNSESIIWIGFHDDFALVVAKANVILPQKNYGDLLKAYTLPTTARFILETNYQDEWQKCYKFINDYMNKVIVIPVSESKKVKDLERAIGDMLLENNIPILNKISHRKGR